MRFETPPPERARRLTSRLIRPHVRSILTSPSSPSSRSVRYRTTYGRRATSAPQVQPNAHVHAVQLHPNTHTSRQHGRLSALSGWAIPSIRCLTSLPSEFAPRATSNLSNYHWLVICECCQAMRVPKLINQNRTESIRQLHESCPSTLPMPDGCSSCGVA